MVFLSPMVMDGKINENDFIYKTAHKMVMSTCQKSHARGDKLRPTQAE